MTHVQFQKFGKIYPITQTMFAPEAELHGEVWKPEIHIKPIGLDTDCVVLEIPCKTQMQALEIADQAIKRGVFTREAFNS